MKKDRSTARVGQMRGDRKEDKKFDGGCVISTAIFSEWTKGIESWPRGGEGRFTEP